MSLVLPYVGFTVSHFNDAHPSTQPTIVHSSVQSEKEKARLRRSTDFDLNGLFACSGPHRRDHGGISGTYRHVLASGS